MRSAVSRFIECISIAHVSLPDKVKRSLLDALNENLRHPNCYIQSATVEALKHFAPAYLGKKDDKAANDIMLKITPKEGDAEARVNAVKGLVSVCETVTETRECSDINSVDDGMSLLLYIKNEVIQSLFRALDDYSVDNRGDVGSWVREVAMDGLEKCRYPLSPIIQFSCYSKYVLSGIVIISIGGLAYKNLVSLLEYLQANEKEAQNERTSREVSLCTDILWVLQKSRHKCSVPGVLESLTVELKGSKDLSKLYAGIAILGYIASISEPISIEAFSYLLTFLAHRCPKIRKAAAEQVYLVLLQNGDLVPEDKIEST
ncbi:hypothetical protein RJ639_043883 [Escallonia herrerae]|uniref:Tubulin-folding cofactor D C-terminal domain-containing protein n=1 Tax=Escallonia herrerae TaxID=1293975 RepID=A0AA88WJC9_9ASTE|nr:hypothetical protein RJ639_043883 [Escallonia herrerae]